MRVLGIVAVALGLCWGVQAQERVEFRDLGSGIAVGQLPPVTLTHLANYGHVVAITTGTLGVRCDPQERQQLVGQLEHMNHPNIVTTLGAVNVRTDCTSPQCPGIGSHLGLTPAPTYLEGR